MYEGRGGVELVWGRRRAGVKGGGSWCAERTGGFVLQKTLKFTQRHSGWYSTTDAIWKQIEIEKKQSGLLFSISPRKESTIEYSRSKR